MIGMMIELRVAPGSTDAFERGLAVFQPYKNTRTKLLDDRNCVARAPRILILIPV